MYIYPTKPDELMHFGIKGMHWGIRRFQNPDGTLIHPKRKKKQEDLSKYSDDELKKMIQDTDKKLERKHLEDTYRKKVSELNPPPKKSTAKSLLEKYAKMTAEQLATKIVKKGTEAAAREIVKRVSTYDIKDKK